MSRLVRAVRARGRGEDGFTLVELLVSMMLFAVVLALIASSTLVMEHGLRKAQGQSDNLDAGRKVVELLDRQVRYANAVTQPSTIGTATYLAWQTGDTDQPQSCTQWRYDSSAKAFAYRKWDVTSVGGSANATGWIPEALDVIPLGSTPVFQTSADASSLTPPSGSPTPMPTNSAGIANSHATVTVTFGIRQGNPATVSQSTVTLTAINTDGVSTPMNICNQVSTP